MLLQVVVAALVLLVIVFLVLRKKQATSSSTETSQKQGTKADKDEDVIQLEQPASPQAQKKAEKKKKKKVQAESKPAVQVKPLKQLQQIYSDNYYGTLSLRNNKNISTVTCLTVKNSKVLVGNSRNQLVLYDLRKWKHHSSCQDQYFTSLDNNTASAVAISQNYYFAALDFEKTIIYFEFKGGEGGVYFRQVRKFNRNIFKSNQGTIYIPQGQKCIVSTGIEADTTINVWSMLGQKLTSISTYQIQHYEIQYGVNIALVRGWTSQVKSFHLHLDKEGNFQKLQKGFHLTLSQKPSASYIDNFGLHALTITGDGEQIKLWVLTPSISNHPVQTTVDCCQIGLNQAKFCSILTLKNDNQRLKTIVVVADQRKMVILDRGLKVVKQFQGVSIQSLHSFGASKSGVIGSLSNGKMSVWDFTKIAQEQPEYVHP